MYLFCPIPRQLQCWPWPEAHTRLKYKIGGTFATGGQQASGLDTVRQDLMTVMLSLSMTVLGRLEGGLGCDGLWQCVQELTQELD